MNKSILFLVGLCFCAVLPAQAYNIIDRLNGFYQCSYEGISYYVNIESWTSILPESFLSGFVETPETQLFEINSRMIELPYSTASLTYRTGMREMIEHSTISQNKYTRKDYESIINSKMIYMNRYYSLPEPAVVNQRGYLFVENDLFSVPYFSVASRIDVHAEDSLVQLFKLLQSPKYLHTKCIRVEFTDYLDSI